MLIAALAHLSQRYYTLCAQVAGGNGEQMISRDIYRLGTRMDFFRLLAFYTTGPGFYMNIFFVLLGVYSTVWAFLVLTVTGAQRLEDGENPGTFINTISGAVLRCFVKSLEKLSATGMLFRVRVCADMRLPLRPTTALNGCSKGPPHPPSLPVNLCLSPPSYVSPALSRLHFPGPLYAPLDQSPAPIRRTMLEPKVKNEGQFPDNPQPRLWSFVRLCSYIQRSISMHPCQSFNCHDVAV